MKNEKIFVGNLNFKATEDDVKELLSAYGTVEKMRYSRKKGHALALMSAREEAEAVIENLDGKHFMERALRVNFEQPPKKGKEKTPVKNEGVKKAAPDKKKKPVPGDKNRNNRDMKGKKSGDKSSSRGNLQDDYDDTKWNRKITNEEERSSRYESAGGYYSRSFKKRLEKATHAFSKYKFKNGYNDSTDDFMKDEFGRDYRDLEKEAEKRHSGGRPKGGPGNRKSEGQGKSQGNRNSRGNDERRGSNPNGQRKVRGRNSERNSDGPRGNSRSGSGNMNSNQGSKGKNQRRNSR